MLCATEPWEAEEMRQSKADMGAIRCDCWAGLPRLWGGTTADLL